MCCNGVLFGDVELQRQDDVRALAALGLELLRKGKKQCFKQPCACFDGKLCRVYERRPSRCQTFECRLLQRVQGGKVSLEPALRAIAEARQAADRVRRLLERLGQTDEHWPLNRRYAEVVAQPIDLSADEETAECRSELMLAVHKLTTILEREFMT
jgi:Fe-S-cluster containining protein